MTVAPGQSKKTQKANDIACIEFPELVSVVNSLLGMDRLQVVSAHIMDVIHEYVARDLIEISQQGPSGFICVMKPDAVTRTKIENMGERLSRPLKFNVGAQDKSGAVIDVDQSVIVRPYIGVARGASQPGNTKTLHKAQVALQWTKKPQYSPVQIYDEVTNAINRGQTRAQQELICAIQEEHLAQFYQPLVDFSDGKIVGFEALLRRPQDSKANLYIDLPESPAVMVEMAATTGMMGALTDLTWKQATETLRLMDRLCPGSNVSVSLNVNGDYLLEHVDAIESRIAKLRDPWRLTLEISENASISPGQLPALQRVIERLRNKGSRIAIDDFGAGSSNFARINELTFDELKLDKSLTQKAVQSRSDAELMAKIIEMAHDKGAQIVAEGIETHAQWQLLKRAGADIAQGYLLSKPQNQTRTIACLQNQSRETGGLVPENLSG